MAEAELTTIARPYARAAFSQAVDDTDGLQKWSRMLALLSSAVQQPVVRTGLDNPRLTTDSEAAFLIDLLGDELDEKGRNFVHVLAEHGRTTLLPEIAAMYELFKANHEKTMNVEVVSAFEVDEADQQMLAAALNKRLQREVTLTTSVDSSLLGGVVIRAEDTVIDNSVRGKLSKLSHALN